jgi:hypothetical protein
MNLILLLADAGLLFVLARRLSLSSSASLFAVAAWMFNFHGINMALLWISGRTELLLCLVSLAAVLVWLRGRRQAAALLTLAAMLCKEEALMLPPLLLTVDLVAAGQRSTRIRSALLPSWPVWVAAAIYLVLRAHSGAFGLSDAPEYYQLTIDPHVVVRNAVEYFDRAAAWAAVAAMLMFLVAPRATSLNSDERRLIRFGIIWFAWMFAITVFVPVRSSLYAVAPSIGSALAAASLASRAERVAPRRFALVSTTLIAAVAVLVPVYRMRNHGLVEPADLATQAIEELQQAAQRRPGVREIVLLDDPDAAVTLKDAFGTLAADAVHLFVAADMHVSTVSIRNAVDAANADVMVLRLRAGRLVQDRLRTNGSPEDTTASHPG